MGQNRLKHSVRRICRTLLQLSVLAAWSMALVCAPEALGAPLSQTSTVSMDQLSASRLIVRFRPEVLDGQMLGDPLFDELQTAMGRKFEVGFSARAGELVLTLVDPVSVIEAKRLVGILRMRRDVIRAELDRSERVGFTAKNVAATGGDDHATVSRFIITFEDPALGILARNNQRLGKEWDDLLSAGAAVPVHVIRPTVGGAWIVEILTAVNRDDAAALAAKLGAMPAVRYATPDYPVSPDAYFPDDPYFQEGYQRDMANPLTTPFYGIDAPEAWDITVGSPLVVAVVDTGVRPHAEIASRLLQGYDFVSDPTNSHDGLVVLFINTNTYNNVAS